LLVIAGCVNDDSAFTLSTLPALGEMMAIKSTWEDISRQKEFQYSLQNKEKGLRFQIFEK
jgi:hypothetical protein